MPRPAIAAPAVIAAASLAGVAGAQISAVTYLRADVYQQTVANDPGQILFYRAAVTAETQTLGLVGAVTVDPPGATPATRLAYTPLVGDYFSTFSTFPSAAARDAAFPGGAYAFSHTGGTAPARSFNTTFTPPAFPVGVPALTAPAIANLGAVVPGQPIPLTLAGGFGVHSAFILDVATNNIAAVSGPLNGTVSVDQ
jgi:hypothetical protein